MENFIWDAVLPSFFFFLLNCFVVSLQHNGSWFHRAAAPPLSAGFMRMSCSFCKLCNAHCPSFVILWKLVGCFNFLMDPYSLPLCAWYLFFRRGWFLQIIRRNNLEILLRLLITPPPPEGLGKIEMLKNKPGRKNVF